LSAFFWKKNGVVLGVAAHFLGVLVVVAADAIDAMDGKELIAALDRESGLLDRLEHISHARTPWLQIRTHS
jgi:hypothetical protein